MNAEARAYVARQIEAERNAVLKVIAKVCSETFAKKDEVMMRATVAWVREIVDPLAAEIKALREKLDASKSPFGADTDKRLKDATRRLTRAEHDERAGRLAYSQRKAKADAAKRKATARQRVKNEAAARARARAVKGKTTAKPVVKISKPAKTRRAA